MLKEINYSFIPATYTSLLAVANVLGASGSGLENINNLSKDKLCSIIISIETCSFFIRNGIFINPEYYAYDVNKVKESLVSKLSK